MYIGFLGGTGIEAKGLALRFAAAGAQVILGSRSGERAAETAEAYTAESGVQQIRGSSNPEMLAAAEIIFLTVPFAEVRNALENYGPLFRQQQVLVDVTVPVIFRQGRVEYQDQEGMSNSEIIARHVPEEIPVVGAFKTIPAEILADLRTSLNCTVFVCGNSSEAKAKVIGAASLIPTLYPVDCGTLDMARTLERMAVLAIGLNRRYKKKGARYHIEGI